MKGRIFKIRGIRHGGKKKPPEGFVSTVTAVQKKRGVGWEPLGSRCGKKGRERNPECENKTLWEGNMKREFRRSHSSAWHEMKYWRMLKRIQR